RKQGIQRVDIIERALKANVLVEKLGGRTVVFIARRHQRPRRAGTRPAVRKTQRSVSQLSGERQTFPTLLHAFLPRKHRWTIGLRAAVRACVIAASTSAVARRPRGELDL